MKKSPLYFPFLLLLTFFLLVPSSFAETVLSPYQCLDCHEDMFKDDSAKKHIHPPFRQRNCLVCHLSSQGEIPPATEAPKGFALADPATQQIKWLAKDLAAASTHWFVVPQDLIATDFYIGGEETRKKIWLQKLPLPSWQEIKELKNDLTPPLIQTVKIESVQRGVFISALITWATDEYADSRIAYGDTALDSYSALDKQFVTEHRMLLMGLKANQQYQFVVISADLFGNKTVSTTFTFSTAEAKTASLSSFEPSDSLNSNQAYANEFYRFGNNYLIKISAGQPGVLYLGTNIHPMASQLASQRDTMKQLLSEGHAILKDKSEGAIQLCYSCHSAYTKYLSHPLGVLPKSGMEIPPEYPLLPDGRISCISCHERHASNNSNRILKPTNRELCIGCHKEMA